MQPTVFVTKEDKGFLESLEERIKGSESDTRVILDYPIVYIHYWSETVEKQYDVYVGESSDIIERTKEHYKDGQFENKWQYSLVHAKSTPEMIVVGHNHFNKSLTMDIENRLIQYVLALPTVNKVHNSKGNPQRAYYPVSEFNDLFSKIWRKLRKHNKNLFLSEAEIKDSAIFKASPFHKLTDQQLLIQNEIIEKVDAAIATGETGQLVFVEGEAGTGKTVLTNSTFYKLLNSEKSNGEKKYDCRLLVNHEEQKSVYQQIAKKLQVDDYEKIVSRPTSFINHHPVDAPIDVAFVDEAHLLWTQGKQSYQGKNQLDDIMKRARVTVIMFDENQILTTEEYWEPDQIDELRQLSISQGNYMTLTNQLRMNAGPDVIEWIDNITKDFVIKPIGSDTKNYDVQVLDSPFLLYETIKKKAKDERSKLSRIVASYDWEYVDKTSPKDGSKYWGVRITDPKTGKEFYKPWNRQLFSTLDKKQRRERNELAWAEQPQTIDEIGSTFTIQGFDLVYSGVIIGPSVQYRNGCIEFHPEESHSKKAIQNRTLSDGKKQRFAEYLLSHELRVLLTRGVKGMYIYACDEALRKALKESLDR